MQIMAPELAPSGDVGETREGKQDSKLLLAGKEGTPDNYKLNLSLAVTDWKAPRHRHNFDQIRYPIRGEFVYAKDKVVPAGSVAYFPEGIHYGPQIRKQGLLIMLCQLGGASGNGFLSKTQRRRAYEELMLKGTFDKGIFSYVDENGVHHSQDSAEAVTEQAIGGQSVYPPPRYNDIIVMNPDNFSWVREPDSPGVSHKWLGTFTERKTGVEFIRLDSGATLNAGLQDTTELLFLVKGSVSCQQRLYRMHSAFSVDALEGPVPISADEPSEFLCIHLPNF